MPFSPRQRQLVSLLAKSGSLTMAEYLLTLVRERREVDADLWHDAVNADPHEFHMMIPEWNGSSRYLLLGLPPSAHLDVLEFFTLMRDLHARKLVTIVSDPKRHVHVSAIAGAVDAAMLHECDAAALEIDNLLQARSELIGLSIADERVYALPALLELQSTDFLSKEEVALARQQTLLDEQQTMLARLVPILYVAAASCIIMCIMGFFAYRSLSDKINGLDASSSNAEQSDATPTVIIKRDTVIVRDTVTRTPAQRPAPRKTPKLWYME